MSESKPPAPPPGTSGQRLSRGIRRLLRSSWSNLRQSRLGLFGFCIVIFFTLIAILAPIISPYPRLFEAPQADRFVVNTFVHQLPKNLTYASPVMGPTTPLSDATGGGMWELNYNTSRGLLYMDYLKYPPLKEIKIPEVATATLANGIRLYLVENHELPLVSGFALVRTGNLFDPPDKIGLAGVTGTVMRTGGTGSRTGDELDALLENMAASVESSIGETSGRVSFSALRLKWRNSPPGCSRSRILRRYPVS